MSLIHHENGAEDHSLEEEFYVLVNWTRHVTVQRGESLAGCNLRYCQRCSAILVTVLVERVDLAVREHLFDCAHLFAERCSVRRNGGVTVVVEVVNGRGGVPPAAGPENCDLVVMSIGVLVSSYVVDLSRGDLGRDLCGSAGGDLWSAGERCLSVSVVADVDEFDPS